MRKRIASAGRTTMSPPGTAPGSEMVGAPSSASRGAKYAEYGEARAGRAGKGVERSLREAGCCSIATAGYLLSIEREVPAQVDSKNDFRRDDKYFFRDLCENRDNSALDKPRFRRKPDAPLGSTLHRHRLARPRCAGANHRE